MSGENIPVNKTANSPETKATKAANRPANQKSVFVKRKKTFTLAFLGIAAVFAVAALVTNYSVIDGFRSIPAAMVWIATNLVPTSESWAKLPKVLEKLFETALLSVAVTVCAAVFAFFFSLMGTKTTKANPVIAHSVRVIAAFFRNVPDVVWAIMLLFSFGQNILTGFFALFFATFGMLTRTFIETIDEVSSSCVEALQTTGATPFQTVFQGIVPSAMPEIVSWVMYMIETNIRASTLIGILTATGIGDLFGLYYRRMDYGAASLVVIFTVILVIIIEMISNQIRKVIM